MANVKCDDNGYVSAVLPANVDYPVTAIGFIGHMDMTPGASGANVKPQVIAKGQSRNNFRIYGI